MTESQSETARKIFLEALKSCDAKPAVRRHFFLKNGQLNSGRRSYSLITIRRVRIVAAGKAAAPMLQAALKVLAGTTGQIDIAGVLIAPEPLPKLPEGFQAFAGGHPEPNAASFAGASAALKLMVQASKNAADTLCVFLISGGASAMMELPLDRRISLADTARFHRVLVGSGATIAEINCVRKHFSSVKGGRLAQAAGNAQCCSLLISDVPRGMEDALGSGPTVADTSTVADCRRVLQQYNLVAQFPASAQEFFLSEMLPETPKPPELPGSAEVILSADDLVREAAKQAESLGWHPVLDTRCDEWDYRDAARYLVDRIRSLRRQQNRVCLISTGEVTVRLPQDGESGSHGLGGRNQQFALYAATLLEAEDEGVTLLSAGSDGVDGNSEAAGAIVDRDTAAVDRVAALQSLENFDSFRFLAAHHATIHTGRTGVNLRDLRVLLAG